MEQIEKLTKDIVVLMRAKVSLFAIESYEEQRAIALFKQIAEDPNVNRVVHVWSCTDGITITDLKNEPIKYPEEIDPRDPLTVLSLIEQSVTNGIGKIFVLLDFQPYMKDPTIIRKIRDLSTVLENTRKSVIFLGSSFPIPEDLKKSIAIFDLPLPNREEIAERIENTLKAFQTQIEACRNEIRVKPELKKEIEERIADLVSWDQKVKDQWRNNRAQIIDAFSGLSDIEITNTCSQAVVKHELSVKDMLKEKKQIIKKSGSIEYIETDVTIADIGGLKPIKQYCERIKRSYSKEAEAFGVKRIKAVLLAGSPGTGKTLTGKAIGSLLEQPLIRLDIGAQTTKWLGESNQNLLKAFKVMHAVSPAVILFDEIEKSIHKNEGSGGSMHEERSSMLSTLLTELEEGSDLLFVATTNNPDMLPPELLNRFQKIFYVDLPTLKERAEIFAIHIKAIKRDPKNFDLMKLAENTPGYSGREIRNIVQIESLSIAFERGSELTTEIILEVIPKIKPVSVQMKNDIERCRTWCDNNAERANDPEIPIAEKTISAGSRKLEI